MDSYPFPMYSGIFEPKHYKQIGAALWFFSWCIKSTTKETVDEEGETCGHVLRGKPMKLSELAEPFGVNEKTVGRWIDTLELHGYIQITRAPYGLIITVRKSKKGLDKNVRSDEREQTYMSDHSPTEQTYMSDHLDKNVRSNKDVLKDLTSSSLSEDEIYKMSQEVEKHFLSKRGKGFQINPIDFGEVKQMISDGLPIDLIKDCIDKTFAEYKPKHQRDEIRTITYCIPRCYDEWTKMQVSAPSITPAVPSAGSVALGSRFKSKQQQQIDELDRFIQEVEGNGGNRHSSLIQENKETLSGV